MDIAGAVCVVTGGGNGIGEALARRFAAADAAGVVVVDLDADGARRVASSLPGDRGAHLAGDVTDAAVHEEAVRLAEERFGPVELYASNAGIGTADGLGQPDVWEAVWRVNVLAHLHAARAVLPSMLDRGHGWLLQTASAAGLLTNLGDAAYTATKHAAVGFAEWLSATYRHRGIGVTCLCPMGVDTDMLRRASDASGGVAGNVVTRAGGILPPEVVADRVVEALAAERFLVLPHPEVATFLTGKVGDIDGWLAAMNRVQQKLEGLR
jgi:NAD(P)-dependent dehydrogenase (short-subunit alcohol dehydrogenase family)